MHRQQIQDIQEFVNDFRYSEQLRGTTFLVTGATGLIGSSLIRCLTALEADIQILAPVRNMAKARQMFGNTDNVMFVSGDLATMDYASMGCADYIIHCAAPTASRYFVEHPVQTFRTIIDVTEHLLDYARDINVKGFIYLSSLEVYGQVPDSATLLTEDYQGYLDPASVRSSYPIAKRAAENLCSIYASQYGIRTMTARLTQTTGAGIAMDDNRIIASFARKAALGQDIILHTTGLSARPYCYVTDAVSALLTIALHGQKGTAYNVANPQTYISARGMAEWLRDNINPHIMVHVEPNDDMGYAPETFHRLDTGRLNSLGWEPRYGLREIFERLINYLTT